jgi:hypothetical protein
VASRLQRIQRGCTQSSMRAGTCASFARPLGPRRRARSLRGWLIGGECAGTCTRRVLSAEQKEQPDGRRQSGLLITCTSKHLFFAQFFCVRGCCSPSQSIRITKSIMHLEVVYKIQLLSVSLSLSLSTCPLSNHDAPALNRHWPLETHLYLNKSLGDLW